MSIPLSRGFSKQYDEYNRSRKNIKNCIKNINTCGDTTKFIQIYVNMIISNDEEILKYLEEGKDVHILLVHCLKYQPSLFHIVYKRWIDVLGQRIILDISELDKSRIDDKQGFIMDLLCRGLYPFDVETVEDFIQDNVREIYREHFIKCIINAEFERTHKISSDFIKLMIRFEIYPESVVEKIKSIDTTTLLDTIISFEEEALIFFAKIKMYELVVIIAENLERTRRAEDKCLFIETDMSTGKSVKFMYSDKFKDLKSV